MKANPSNPFSLLFSILLITACAAPVIVDNRAQPTTLPPTPTVTQAQEPTAVPTEAAPPAVTEVSLLPTATPTSLPAPIVPPADEASERLVVPAGFAIRIFAEGLNDPRLMTVGADGNLYVAERGKNVVIRLPDGDGDGLADERQVVAEKLNNPHSVEWYENSLIVAENDQITRLTDLNGDGDMKDEGESVVITDNIPTGGGHTSRTAHVGPDGKLYTVAGSSDNNTPETDPRRAAISRFNLDGSVPEDNPYATDSDKKRQVVWAQGLRNSVDFAFLPDGQLWADHNGSDMLGDNLPPEEIVIQIEKGKHYGWPFCYTPTLGVTPPNTQDVRDTRVAFKSPITDCSQATPALFTDLAHQAPLGMSYYSKAAFPAEYQNNLFVAYHGSWNSSKPRDCKVERIVVVDGKPVEGKAFITGFRKSDTESCGSAWGRPAGVAVGANGELFVSDDQNGNIYRVVYVGG